jgi:hypothetical protein
MTFAIDRVDAKPCFGCRKVRDIVEFPHGRPRIDGSRHRMRFCEECLASRAEVDRSQKDEVNRIARRESRFRRRIQRGHW